MSIKNKSGKSAPAVLVVLLVVLAAFFGISIPANLFGGGNEAASSVPVSSDTQSVTSSFTSSDEEISAASEPENSEETVFYHFRSESLYHSHYEKHGTEFGNITKEEYLQKANDLINSDSPDILTKYEDDGDFMYFNKKTNEFLVLSPDGYIRTYFIPSDGINYWNRQ